MTKDFVVRKEFQKTGLKGNFILYVLDKYHLLRPQILSEVVIIPRWLKKIQAGDNLGRPPGTLGGHTKDSAMTCQISHHILTET